MTFNSRLRSLSKATVPVGIDQLWKPQQPALLGTKLDQIFYKHEQHLLCSAHEKLTDASVLSGANLALQNQFPSDPVVGFDYTGNVGRVLWQPVRVTKLYSPPFPSLATTHPSHLVHRPPCPEATSHLPSSPEATSRLQLARSGPPNVPITQIWAPSPSDPDRLCDE